MTIELYTPILLPREPGLRLDPGRLPWRNGLLIRATNWLGDALMTLPAVYRLSRVVPDPCGVFVMCPAFMQPLWEAAPWVSQVIPMSGSRSGIQEHHRVRQLRPGVAVVLPNSFGAAWDVFRRGIPIRLGRSGRGRSLLLTHRLPEWPRARARADCHQLSRYLELAAVFGAAEASVECPPLELPDAAVLAAKVGVQADVGPWLAIAPGAAYGLAKQWPVEHFTALADWWQRRGGRVVVVGTAKERAAGEAIRAHGMQFNAGHALNYVNVGPVAALPGLNELHIGHAIVSEAVFTGLRSAVARMRACIDGAAAGVHSRA